MIADTFDADLKKTTGVDILQLETNGSSDGQDAAGVKVTVGKHLSDRITFTLTPYRFIKISKFGVDIPFSSGAY